MRQGARLSWRQSAAIPKVREVNFVAVGNHIQIGDVIRNGNNHHKRVFRVIT